MGPKTTAEAAAQAQQRTILLPDIDWVEIPGGEFVYQDRGRRSLRTFHMARYPVTNFQYQTFMNAGGYWDERWWAALVRPEPERSHWRQANRPRTNVDWYEAVAFSRWLSAKLGYEVRLPTEEEWERAARGHDGREYPWGEDYQTGYANTDEKGAKAGDWSLGQTIAVGVYLHEASTEGVLDLAGNVWEWCVNKYKRPDQIAADTSGDSRVLRGGAWLSLPDLARGSQRYWYLPDYRDYLIGFRLVSSAPIA
ncbi:SUMF1/EgtB/PvdO family nonheme iron enzyme [Candidatus Accumulibacter sp. ACC005]|jgi:formylglycine-generating enzyme required for sulfatase activity|uniref:formylglycine-generating enzyme family protein n=1 Tax=Candidatus Accumulibacter sp. ACC005 TaxID=2823331 RepID=UPI0025C710EC|nr:SUMF1/EgtB/PvdO family nonheme iron enzyme [Candidatus Accumulibacter sp. ACC005]